MGNSRGCRSSHCMKIIHSLRIHSFKAKRRETTIEKAAFSRFSWAFVSSPSISNERIESFSFVFFQTYQLPDCAIREQWMLVIIMTSFRSTGVSCLRTSLTTMTYVQSWLFDCSTLHVSWIRRFILPPYHHYRYVIFWRGVFCTSGSCVESTGISIAAESATCSPSSTSTD